MLTYARKVWVLPILFILVLAFALLMTSPVFADDGQPVDPPAVEEVTAPPPVEEPAPVEEPPVEDAPAEMEAPTAPPVEESQPLPRRDTTLGVVEGDPFFTVGSTTYTFTAVDCDPDTAGAQGCGDPIQQALDYMAANSLTPTDRKLYVESVDDVGDDYNEDVFVDGLAPGVKGLLALVGTGATSEDVVINGSISVYEMPTGFTIQNMSVFNDYSNDAAITFGFNHGLVSLVDVNATASGTDGIGIAVFGHFGGVELNRVKANDNGYHGAIIDIWTSAGSVKVINSEFNHNLLNAEDGWGEYDSPWNFDGWWDEFDNYDQGYDPTGLVIYPWMEPTTLNGVEASDNLGSGARISGWTNTVSVTNSVFNNNDFFDLFVAGLSVDGNIVTLQNILASGNGGNGISSYVNTSLTGSTLYLENNGRDGLFVDSCQDWDDNSICNITGPGTVTIKMSSSTSNGGSGYAIYSKGAITIADAYVAGNGESGYYLDNSWAPTPMPVTVTNAHSDDNGLDGFDIYSRGAVTLTNFNASYNDGTGLYLLNTGPGAVTLTNAGTDFNSTVGNGLDGYYIESLGAITIINTDTYENGSTGAYIDNAGAATAAPVTIKVLVPSSSASWFGSNGLIGLEIYSRGVVTISKIEANWNGGPGAVINNVPSGTLPGVAVTVTDSEFSNNYDGNDLTHSESGLGIISKGAITLLNVTATDNDGDGAYLDNMAGTAGVTINAGTNLGNRFLRNQDTGLVILTKGAVTLTNVNATENAGYGLLINNLGGSGAVTIKETGNWGAGFDYYDPWTWGNSFSRNGQDGLNILTKGVVNVVFNHASENGWNGIFIDASNGAGTVTVAGNTNHVGDVYYNGHGPSDNGITIDAKGTITLTKVNVIGNFDYGANLNNFDGTGGITLTEAFFDNNYNGLLIETKGAVLWKTGSASGNLGYGAMILNSGSLAPYKSVTISNVLTTNNNGTGLFIDSKGAILLTNVESNNNSANFYMIEYSEKWLDNQSPEQTWFFEGQENDNVTIKVNSLKFTPSIYVYDSGWNLIDMVDGFEGSAILNLASLDYDDTYRIQVMTDMGWDGFSYDISIYQGLVEPVYTVREDAANGMYLMNNNGVNAPVTITNTYHPWNSNNSGTDIVILSSGAVALSNMDINDSREGGLIIDNTFSATTPGVTLTGVNFLNNDLTGADIKTDGAVTIKNSVVGGNGINGGHGIHIDNDDSTGAVTLTNVDINGSGLRGLWVQSHGAVTLTDIWSNGNGMDGIWIATNGAVTMKNIDANDNNGFGAFVTTPSTFTVLQPAIGYNHFSGNMLEGLYAETSGKITLTNVRASSNGWWDEDIIDTYADGIHLENNANLLGTAPIVLTNIETNWNTLDGLDITTTSAVTITAIQSQGNTDNGVYVAQLAGPIVAPVITLTDIDAFGNGMDGLHVDAFGNIITNKLQINSNGNLGVYLNNEPGTGSVTVLNSKGYNFVGFNGDIGMFIASRGVVTVTGVEALGNAGDGVRIINSNALVPNAVTVNSMLLRNNGLRDVDGNPVLISNGLTVDSDGIVTINSSWSLGNTGHGYLVGTGNNVFFNNSTAIQNDRGGITVYISDLTKILKLTGSTWMGNLKYPQPGDKNLKSTVTPVIL